MLQSSTQFTNTILRNIKILPPKQFHTTSKRFNLFDKLGSKSLQGSLPKDTETLLRPRSAKQVAPTNPADILTQNDILMYSNKPLNYIESIKTNGFHLNNNFFIKSPNLEGEVIGLLLVGSETFEIKLGNKDSAMFEINNHIVTFNDLILNIFKKLHPKPEILIIGLGKKTSRIMNLKNKSFFNNLGINLEISDSFNGGQIFDLLSTERPGVIGALLLPPNV
ncbi:uncharacterized protein KGF55_000472 [Candida pseudojiufengensis]|uniref:uncharacterized protein n=1 Tax=Candida pseudojiufengensis TaxID=497109 RepID=UPI00222412D0|nr:uncharacterized protein KGF55_000472 [Candida pseudojiufengensis]KAI5966163.1 hypothetical protein KGF55_000472 [Candida pseudojiufengensis]